MRDARENGAYSIRTTYCKGCLVCVQECPTGCLEKVPELDFDEPDSVTRMETAFAPYDGAHAEQSGFTRQLIEDAIADYDAARTVPRGGNGHAGGDGKAAGNGHKDQTNQPNGSGVTQ
jgi:formate hydrogenlyase subunit 6/NADH:ubiquinone oxidoreductase subunit I